MVAKKSSTLEDIIDKNDKDLIEMIDYIKRDPRIGFVHSKKFKVFTLETSRGKTTGTAYAIAKSITEGKNTKFIFTTKTLKECRRIAEIINKECNSTYAMHYTPSTEEDTEISSSDFYKCAKSKVLILTHASYLNLCSPKNKYHENYAKYAKNNFQVLVVDEEINAVTENLCIFNNHVHENTLKLLNSTNNKELIGLYNMLCDLLKKIIDYFSDKKYDNKILVAEKDTVDIFPHIAYEELVDGIRKIDEQVIKDYARDNKVEVSKTNILDAINKIYILYQNVDFDRVLYWNSALYSCNFDFKFFMLDKNIMLDASSNFNTLYEISELFEVVKSSRIIDHSNCNLYWHNYNTSRSAKKKTSVANQLTNWREFIIKDIKRKALKDSEVLIITNKAECLALEEDFIEEDFQEQFENYSFLNFFNMRGIDDYANYKECFIVHTHRYPFPIYVLMYMYYVMKEDVDIFKLDMVYGKYRGNNSVGFRDKTLDGLLFSDEISALYQGCKRICRSREPVGNFHVYNSNFDTVKAIQDELYNVRVIPDAENKKARLSEEFYFTIKKIRDGVYSDYKITDSKSSKKVKAVKRGRKNFYEVSKKLFYEVLNTDNTHFSRDVIDKVNEKELNIKFHKDKIIVNF